MQKDTLDKLSLPFSKSLQGERMCIFWTTAHIENDLVAALCKIFCDWKPFFVAYLFAWHEYVLSLFMEKCENNPHMKNKLLESIKPAVSSLMPVNLTNCQHGH